MIDFVITWVDGSDPAWQKKRSQFRPGEAEDAGTIRYRDWGLLRYWFRAVENFAPWVRRVYLVTDNQCPPWLNRAHPTLVLADHRDFIPEKYLLTGEQLDKVPAKLIDQNKIDLQKRLGYPVYNVCDLEVGRERKSYRYVDTVRVKTWRKIQSEMPRGKLKDNGGSPIAGCSGMKVVPTLYYIQGSSNFEKRAAIVADALRKIQYRRAQKSLKTFFLGLKAEKELQKDHPARVQVLNQILVQAVKYGQTWNNMLQKAIDEKKFLFSLTDPNGQMDSIDKVDYYHPRTTWGYYSKEGLKPIIVKDIEEQKKLMLLWKQRVRD